MFALFYVIPLFKQSFFRYCCTDARGRIKSRPVGTADFKVLRALRGRKLIRIDGSVGKVRTPNLKTALWV